MRISGSSAPYYYDYGKKTGVPGHSLIALLLFLLLQLSWRLQPVCAAGSDDKAELQPGIESRNEWLVDQLNWKQRGETDSDGQKPMAEEETPNAVEKGGLDGNQALVSEEGFRGEADVLVETEGKKSQNDQQQQSEETVQQQSLEHSVPEEQAQSEQQIMAESVDEPPHPHARRNYASKECGAKVLHANEEAENRGAILNDPERDDYLRNPCERAQNKFLIIELCETIQPTSLDLANFELFSSNPKNFRLWGAERYPTQDWALVGEFEAQDSREIQSFLVQPEHAAYAKFVKLELLSHYGKEHFCTLSTFRLYGTSMVDEYEAEASSSSSATTSSPPMEQEEIREDITILVDQRLAASETTGFALPENGIGNLYKQKSNGAEEDPLYEDYENNTAAEEENGACDVEGQSQVKDALLRGPEREGELLASNGTTDKKLVEMLAENEQEEEEMTKQQQLNAGNGVEKEDRGKEFAGNKMLKTIVELGTNLKQALGQAFNGNRNKVEHPLEGGAGTNGSASGLLLRRGRRRRISATHLWRHSLLRQNPTSFCRLCPRHSGMRQCDFFCRTFFPSTGQKLEWQKIEARKRGEKARLEFLDRVLRRQTAAFCPLPPKPLTCRRKSEVMTNEQQRAGQQRQAVTEEQPPQQQRLNGQQPNGAAQAHQNGKQQPPVPQQRPVLASSKIVDKANIRPIPGTSTTHKESVFMKLNKRLAILEQNLSTSSEQMAELRRRCAGQQQPDETKQEEKMLKTAERIAKQESKRVEDEMRLKMSDLQRQVNRLSQQLQAVTTAVQLGGPGGGFFYRPFLTPIHGYAASDGAMGGGGQCQGQNCVNGGGGELAPLHSTSSAAFDSSMPIVTATHNHGAGENANEGLWTTQQVVCLCLLVQIGTILTLKIVYSLCNRLNSRIPSTSSNWTEHVQQQQQQAPVSPVHRPIQVPTNSPPQARTFSPTTPYHPSTCSSSPTLAQANPGSPSNPIPC